MTTAASESLYPGRNPIAILGVPFDPVTMTDTLALIERMIASRKPHYIVTANMDFIVQAQSDAELHRILAEANLVLCDGTPLVWTSKLLGNPLPERVAGSDLVPRLIRVAADKRFRLFFLGASPQSAEKAVANLVRKYPGLIANYYSPPFKPLLEMDHEEIERRIREARPDILFVSLGCPKQEKWIAMHRESLGVPVTIGVGATIDFLAGEIKRAPDWMGRCGLEWSFRLLQEPRRLLKRYATDFRVFGWRILGQISRLKLRPASSTQGFSEPIDAGPNCHRFILPRFLDATTANSAKAAIDHILTSDRHCLLDFGRVEAIDSTGAGLLLRLHKQLRAARLHLILIAPKKAVRLALTQLELDRFFAIAPDVPSALTLCETLSRERTIPVTLRTAAASSPLIWQGEVTATNAARVWFATRAFLKSVHPTELAVDLSAVRFIDSTGVDVMARTKTLARQEGIRLYFTGVTPSIQRVLQLANFEMLPLKKPESDSTDEKPAAPALVLSGQQT